MSGSMNKTQLLGNLTKNPEIKETTTGKKVATFSVATNESWKDAQGVKQTAVEYHSIVAWDKLAELAEKYLEKGKQVLIEGPLKTRSWDDPETGEKKYKTEIIAKNLILLGNKKDGGGDEEVESEEAPVKQAPKATAAAKAPSRKVEPEINIEDIPF